MYSNNTLSVTDVGVLFLPIKFDFYTLLHLMQIKNSVSMYMTALLNNTTHLTWLRSYKEWYSVENITLHTTYIVIQ